LRQQQFYSVEQIALARSEELEQVEGLSKPLAAKVQQSAQKRVGGTEKASQRMEEALERQRTEQ